MSLGAGALKVRWEPERLKHSKEVSMATLQAGTTAACSRQLEWSYRRNSVENTHLTPYLPTHKPKKKGGKGWEPEFAKIRFSTRSAKISSKCQSEMRCKSQDKQRPLWSPHRSHTPEQETADCIGLQFNFA